MTPSGYLRLPSLQGDDIVFVCDDDLWRVTASGGNAHRLSAGLSEPSTPCLSPDGRWLAYISRDEQHAEVYLMAAEGGPAQRLTWLGAETFVRGWTADGRILIVSNHGQPFLRNLHAYTLDLAGGSPEALPLGAVNHFTTSPGGVRVIGRNTADPARWKRYRGGTAGHLWIAAAGSDDFRRMTELAGNISNPMWVGERLYFLSDFEGVGNLYSVPADGSALRRHSDHDAFYARHAASDGRRIVYQCAGEIWLYDPTDDSGAPIAIGVPGHRVQAARRFVPAAEHLQGVRLHPQGHSLAAEVRGQLHTMALWEGAVLRHGGGDGVRHQFGHWLGDGQTLVAVSDASGEPRIELGSGPDRRELPWDCGRITALLAAPRGGLLAIANHRNQLLIGDTAAGTLRVADTSDAGRIEDLAWSADGSWLAYAFWVNARHRAIKLCEAASGRTALVTVPEFHDHSPSFDPAGKHLAFLSIRTFDPVYDSVQFELSFPRAARPYLIALRANAAPPFEPLPKGLKPTRPDGGEGAGAAAGSKAPADSAAVGGDAALPLVVDLDGIVQRIAAFPVPEGRYGQLACAAGAKVVWTLLPIVGAHGRGGHKEASATLERFDFATGRTETLMAKVDGFTLAADHATLLVRQGKKLRAIAVDAKPAGDDKDGADTTPSRKSGWVDLDRIRVPVEPRAEWRQMLRETWRLQRDQFWDAEMSGVDWDAVWTQYAPLVDRVATRAELSDLIWELQGELGTSHAYEMGGDHRKPPAVGLGHLGATLRHVSDEAGYEIVELVEGDPWDNGADSPLRAPGVEARVGERIVAVGGQPVSRAVPPGKLLVNQAGMKVSLTLASDAGRREVLVTTVADESAARYREWVERRRAWVHKASGGRVGYFHLPDMMSAGYAEFHRYFSAECDLDGLIVDLRYNRGGHVSQLLLEKVARRRIAYNFPRWGRPEPYPDAAVAGPVVALANEHSGSDGDIFSHGFKLMNLGTLVGTRTWGGVIGIWPRHQLVDGSMTTQPEYSFWFEDVGWGVENYGTDPQVEVDNAPQDAAAGRDRQLEVALAEVQKAIARDGVSAPQATPRPQLARPALPPRP